MTLAELVETSRAVAGSSGRRDKEERLAALLRALAPGEVPVAVGFLAGAARQGRLGIGPAALRAACEASASAASPSLAIADVDRALDALAGLSGPGSARERVRLLSELLARATDDERGFLAGLVTGEVRQGALEGVLAAAVARAAGVPLAAVRRALARAGDLGSVAAIALGEGEAGLAALGVELFRPLPPMLAGTADGVEDALERLGESALEAKLDGARIQAHKAGDLVRVFSRRGNEVTASVPEVVAAVAALPAREVIVDGEAIALAPDGRPLPFQETMRRFGRAAPSAGRAELSTFLFDVLWLDGEPLLDRPLEVRIDALAGIAPLERRVARLVTADPGAAEAFLAETLARGHEGLVAKALGAPYEAGRRGAAWLKLKPAHALDLVVLAAEWGHGRRSGWLSNLHLGARDPRGGFIMLGKTFKGLTDATLAWQTERLLALEVAREPGVVHVRPELVVEIAFDGVQASPRYPGGVALRFARVKRYRPDKAAADADTIDAVKAVHAGGAAPPGR